MSIDELDVVTRDCRVKLSRVQAVQGSCLAFIGPNGSGKTTILETVLGLRKTAALRGSLLGADFAAWRKRADLRRRLGVLLQRAYLPAGMFVRDIVRLHGGLYQKTSPAILDALGIPPLLDKKYDRLSRGETLRAELMLGLAHEPEMIFLDEPYTGLDSHFMTSLGALLQRLKAAGSTIVMACHSAQELQLADQVAWMTRGELRALEPPQDLLHRLLGDYRLQVSFAHPREADRFRQQILSGPQPQALIVPEPTRLIVFGSESLVRCTHGLVDDNAATMVEFGRTTLVDLLVRCAQDNAHA
jgi:ABC-2 type transport system ATP-binding protein